MLTILSVFGTRPEAIKLAPVIERLEREPGAFRTVNVSSGQHDDLLQPFIRLFGIRVDHELNVMQRDQSPTGVCASVLRTLDPVLAREHPDLVLIQGDTTTAMAAALAAFYRRIPVGHVEAGLRSGDPLSPYPEEMNRRLISRLATHHFAATPLNRETLLNEGVAEESVFVTGNPVVDALKQVAVRATASAAIARTLDQTKDLRRIVLTTHRRESFGAPMAESLRVLRRFVEARRDAALLFPVHPNPAVVKAAQSILSGHARIHLLEPLGYEDFTVLLRSAFLIVSDSGGVQEEAPSLGKPLLILRENTERPEAVECGIARLVGQGSERLAALLEEAWRPGSWAERVDRIENPFGRGDSGQRIVEAIAGLLARTTRGAAMTSREMTATSKGER